MIPWDWIGIVTIRIDTRCMTSTNGMITSEPRRAQTQHPTQPEQHPLLVLLDDPHREDQQDHQYDEDGDDDGEQGAHA